jgi:small neutral amino acid transporter SnatA (MarC family)
MKLSQSYVIEVDGTKRPMSEEESRDLQRTISIVPLAMPFVLVIWLINKIIKHNTLPTKE